MANPLYDRLFAGHIGKAQPFLTLPGGKVVTYIDFLKQAAQFAHVFTGPLHKAAE